MSVNELAAIKAWHVAHRGQRPVEYHVYDLVLALWLFGALGVPAMLMLDWMPAVAVCGLCAFTPTVYVGWRRRLHRQGRVRCDWLDSLIDDSRAPPPAA
ncbi:hypothetical protein [Ideonella livida]|uniref:Uncharacterized protein n=1 Tax=Ideonella livida TaxID=2707176 RepID=A0A7C9TK91_9BURK|nr:hypothetical protein [Ideonella livida]NDY91564.1 hypothetical protein [Ideonella livida]